MNDISKIRKLNISFNKMIKDISVPARLTGIAFTLILLIAIGISLNSYSHSETYHFNPEAMMKYDETDNMLRYTYSGIAVPKGSYTLEIRYSSAESASFEFQFGNEANGNIELPAGYAQSVTVWFSREMPMDIGKVSIYSSNYQPIEIEDIIMTRAEGPIYNDGLIWAVIYAISIVLVWLTVIDYSRQEHKKAFRFTVLMIFVFLLPIVIKQVGVRGTDTCGHIMRIEGIYYGLLDHQFPVVINPEWNNDHGQLGILYPNFFLYPAAFLRLLGVSEYGAWRFTMLMLCVLSGSIAYRSSKVVFKEDWQMMVAIAMTMMAPMHLADLYGDGKIGGAAIAEMFAPMIVAGLYDLYYNEGKKFYYLSIGVAAVICSHVTSATVVAFEILLVALINFKKNFDRARILAICKAIGLFLLLSIGSLVCFIRYYYTDWGHEALAWRDFYSSCFRAFDVITCYDVFSFILIVLVVSFLIVYISQLGIRELYHYYGFDFLLAGAFLWLMTTQYFPWPLLRNIDIVEYYTDMLQAGYRFLVASDYLIAFGFVGLLSKYVNERPQNKIYKVFIGMVSVALIIMLPIEVYDYVDPERTILFYDEVIGETDFKYEDYLPKGTKREWYESSEGEISDYEAVNTLMYSRNGTHTLYQYTCSAEGEYVVFPQFVYEGYIAWDENGQTLDIIKNEHNKIRFDLEKTDTPKEIHVKFKVFPYLTATAVIQFLAWGSIALLFGIIRVRKLININSVRNDVK